MKFQTYYRSLPKLQPGEGKVQVSIKKFDVAMDVKNNGIEFEVYDNAGSFLGDVIVAKAGLTWCKGKTSRKKGVKVSWKDFIDWMES